MFGILLSSSVPAAWDTTTCPAGSHTAGIYVTDTAGNDAAASVSITVDNTPPSVSITAPANGSALCGIVDITADVYDTYLADTSITDDMETFGSDDLPTLINMRIGTDPLKEDTDADGLTDEFELLKLGLLTDPLSGTTNGIPDTDGDTLDDGEDVRSGTNPLLKDTDNDGFDDDSEVKLGTDPLIADSNGNGVLDGNETYVQTFTNATAGVEATIAAVGDAGKPISIGLEQEPSILIIELSNVVKTVDISTASEVKSAHIQISYNPAQVSDPSKLRMFHYN